MLTVTEAADIDMVMRTVNRSTATEVATKDITDLGTMKRSGTPDAGVRGMGPGRMLVGQDEAPGGSMGNKIIMTIGIGNVPICLFV